jgi:hypothetical protein
LGLLLLGLAVVAEVGQQSRRPSQLRELLAVQQAAADGEGLVVAAQVLQSECLAQESQLAEPLAMEETPLQIVVLEEARVAARYVAAEPLLSMPQQSRSNLALVERVLLDS